MDLRSKIRLLVKNSDLSLRELSRQSGVRRPAISHFLTGGNIHLNNLEKLMTTLGYEVALIEALTKKKQGQLFITQRLKIDFQKLELFCHNHHISYLSLFGSVLRKDFKKDSDIDILIDFSQPKTFFEILAIEEELKEIMHTNHPLDVVTLNALSPLIATEVINNNEVLYDQAA
jgi:uncharacterized protein